MNTMGMTPEEYAAWLAWCAEAVMVKAPAHPARLRPGQWFTRCCDCGATAVLDWAGSPHPDGRCPG